MTTMPTKGCHEISYLNESDERYVKYIEELFFKQIKTITLKEL